MGSNTYFCKHCQARREFVHDSPPVSHILELSISVLTLGLWIPVWFYRTLSRAACDSTCQTCGQKSRLS